MPEIKHSFAGGKMNKDLDERLVPNGEYRDAMNIQVRTTDADSSDGVGDAGTVQNIKGNKLIDDFDTTTTAYSEQGYLAANKTTIVTSIADEKNNTAYFFVAGPNLTKIDRKNITGEKLWIDSIVEINTGTGVNTPDAFPVVVDKWAITDTKLGVLGDITPPTGVFQQLEVVAGSKYRIGMIMTALDEDGAIVNNMSIEIQDVQGDTLFFYNEQEFDSTDWDNIASFVFEYPSRVLNFNPNFRITGVNIIDDLLFWTDNTSEPKKINIKRCKEGCSTGDDKWTEHTQLKLKDPLDDDELVDYVDYLETPLSPSINNDLKEEHLTVKRKAPTMAPTLTMSESDREGEVEFTGITGGEMTAGPDGILSTNDDIWVAADFLNFLAVEEFGPGSEVTISDIAFNNVNYQQNDILIFTEETDATNVPVIKVSLDSDPTFVDGVGTLSFTVISITGDLVTPSDGINLSGSWTVELERRKPLFELKFGRFGCRYKYDDGEYSSFSPWSELAFLPGHFDYSHKKGYNLGMVNNLRELIIKDFIPHQRTRNADVVSVDILYKTTVSPNVYVVKTLTRGMDPEWDLFTPGAFNSNMTFGELNITSEMIHKVVDKNQLLRAWDNVPRFALAQEVAANRIVYSNYVQGYNIKDSVKLTQNHKSSETPTVANPEKSIKSIRDYRFGMVFGDKYGRETPVISPGYITGDIENNYTLLSGDTTIEKQFASMKNTFELKQEWSNPLNQNGLPENWMEYVKYYVKETSNEYYNLIMDRWYPAEDGNIWLSFASADRNKVDEETYLILKNEHGNNIAVQEKARYKIIAIKNEAPDDIKLDPRSLGKVLISEESYGQDDNNNFGVFEQDIDDNPNLTLNTSPTILMGPNKSIRIDGNTWNDFLKGFSIGLSQGKLQVRVVGINAGETRKGRNWMTVTYHTVVGDANDGVVRWQKAFGEDADMKDRFEAEVGEGNLTDLAYYLEFRHLVIDNKAQFDGKFFVKVEKDTTLETRVLKYTNANVDWDSSSTYNLGYVDTQQFNPGIVATTYPGPRAGYEFFDDVAVPSVVCYDNDSDCDTGASWNNWEGNNIAVINEQLELGGPNWFDGNNIFSFALGCQADNASIVWENGNINGVWNKAGRTRVFWRWLYRNYNDTPYGTDDWPDEEIYFGDGSPNQIRYKMFIDGARAQDLRIKNGNTADGDVMQDDGFCGNIDQPIYNTDGSLIAGDVMPNKYYKPTGIDEGYLLYPQSEETPEVNPTTGDLGRISISILRAFTDATLGLDLWTPNEQRFKDDMTTKGTLFQFAKDPNVPRNIYQVVSKQEHVDTWNRARNQSTTEDANHEWSSSINAGWTDTLNPQEQAGSGGGLVNITIPSFAVFGSSGVTVGGNVMNAWNEGGASGTTFSWYQLLAGASGCYNNLSESGNSICKRCWQEEVGDNGQNWSAPGDQWCYRHGFRVEFRKYNTETGELALGVNGPGSAGIDITNWDPRAEICHDGREMMRINIIKKSTSTDVDAYIPTANAACWETEPKEDVGLDLYYEASNAIPMFLTSENTLDFVPYASKVTLKNSNLDNIPLNSAYIDHYVRNVGYTENTSIIGVYATEFETGDVSLHNVSSEMTIGQVLVFTHKDGTKTMSEITRFMKPLNSDGTDMVPLTGVGNMSETLFKESDTTTGFYEIESDVYQYPVELAWFNCYSFGNGVESDRIRDDYNAPMIDNGVKLSTTFLQYGKETKGSGMIYSGLYNSISGVNNLNEFNNAEKITKDINPSYGSIQALKTRDTDIVVLTEDKILKVTTNKDALYNADGNAQLLASNKVLGTAVPFVGDYGISNNPESLAWDQYRLYFTDMQRGAVLRLSGNGLTPISNVGMKTWFRDNLRETTSLLGTFDVVNGEYNLTLDKKVPETISFNEGSKGWVSFKSFIPQAGVSVGGKYFTGKTSSIWEHYVDIEDTDLTSSTFEQVINRNTFYGDFRNSTINVLFNDMPGSVKSFRTINYEGSQAKIINFTDGMDDPLGPPTQPDGTPFDIIGDNEYYNLSPKHGWWVNEIITDLSNKGSVFEFKEKEGKWFNRIDGDERGDITNEDLNEFSVQGLGEMVPVDDTTNGNGDGDGNGNDDGIGNDTINGDGDDDDTNGNGDNGDTGVQIWIDSDYIDDPENIIDGI